VTKILSCTMVFCCVLLSEADAQLVSVDIEKIELNELYAVEYRSYTEEPIGAVTMYNPTSRELRATVILSGEQYINAPMKMTAKLPAKQKTDIPLHIDLDIGVIDLGRRVEHIPISIEVSAYLGNVKVNSQTVSRDIIVHDRHKLPDGDPSKIAMFVDPGDEYVMSELSAGMGSTSEEKAAAAFALLQKKGIYCTGTGSAQIQYPRELLKIKFGSFYDCSLLYAAVLELLGVEAKLIFNSDVMLPMYKHQGEWHPVDMNMLSLNFEGARSSGEKLQYSMSSQVAQEVVLREAWKKYPPLRFPELAPEHMKLLESVDEYIEEDRLDDAAKVFDQLLEEYPDQPVLLNNAANVDLLMGNAQRAVARYTRAAGRSPDDGGLYLNTGIAYYKLGDEEKSIEFLGKAYTKLGSYRAMCRLLNLDEENRFYEEIDSLLRKAIHQTTEVFTVALGARSLAKSAYPLYWKRFH
jgi:tetratricopeptide (TPR) repeat protein